MPTINLLPPQSADEKKLATTQKRVSWWSKIFKKSETPKLSSGAPLQQSAPTRRDSVVPAEGAPVTVTLQRPSPAPVRPVEPPPAKDVAIPATEQPKATSKPVTSVLDDSAKKPSTQTKEIPVVKTKSAATAESPKNPGPSLFGHLGINLIPRELSVEEQESAHRRFVVVVVVIVGLCLALGGAYGVLHWRLQATRVAIQQAELVIKNQEQTVTTAQARVAELKEIQQHIALTTNVLQRHVYWTNFFEFLEKHTINDVYYTNFSMTGTEELTLSAEGKDVASVARQLVAFSEAKDVVAAVSTNAFTASVNPATGEYEGVRFTINLKLKPGVFYYRETQ